MALGENADLVVRLSLKDDLSGPLRKVGTGLRGIETQTTKAATGLSRVSAGLKGFGTSVAGGLGLIPHPALLATAAILGTVAALGSAIRGAIEEEKSIAKLDAALKANVDGWDGNKDAIDRAIDSGMKLAFTDDEMRESMAKLVVRSGDVDTALRDMALAEDYARLKGIGLSDASSVIAKALQGNVRALKEMGIELPKGATELETYGAIQAKVAGQARAFANTTAGAMQAASIALDEVSDDIGKALLPVMESLADVATNTLVPAMRTAGDAFGYVKDQAQNLHDALDPSSIGVDEFDAAMIRIAQETGASVDDVYKVFFRLPPEVRGSMEEIEAAVRGGVPAFQALKTAAERTSSDARGHLASMKRFFGVMATETVSSAGTAADGWHVMDRTAYRITDKVVKYLTDLGPSMKSAISSGKDDVRAAMADIEWAMKHPFANDKYADWLAGKIRTAEAAKLRAQRRGDAAVVLEITQTINAMKAEIDRLNGLDTFVNIGFNYGTSGRTYRPGGRQHGGPVRPGEAYTVGEKGPETLVMGHGNGYVIPNSRGGNVGWGSSTPQAPRIVVNLKADLNISARAVRQETDKVVHWGGVVVT